MAGLFSSGAPTAPKKTVGVQPSSIGVQYAPQATGRYGTNTAVTDSGQEYDVRNSPSAPKQRTVAPAANPASQGVVQSMLAAALQQQAAPQGPAPSAPPINNSVAPNPVSNGVIDQLQARAAGDMGAGASLDRGIQRIRANASQGIGKEMAASRAARGVSGGGLDDADNRGLAQQESAAIGGLTTDIAIGREKERDSLIESAGGMGLRQGDQQLAAQQQQTAAYNAQRDFAYRDAQTQTQNFHTILDILARSGALDGGGSALYGSG